MTQAKLGLCGFTIGAAQYYRKFKVLEVQETFYTHLGTSRKENARGYDASSTNTYAANLKGDLLLYWA